MKTKIKGRFSVEFSQEVKYKENSTVSIGFGSWGLANGYHFGRNECEWAPDG